jgi:hypothetical protein
MDTSSKSPAEGEISMKHFTFEQLAIASAPSRSDTTRNRFTDDVMARIRSSTSLQEYVSVRHTSRIASFFYKLRHLPAFATIVIALVTLLAVTGTAYAITQLWVKPIVHIQSPVKSVTGRTEVIASLQNCGNEVAKQTVEVKKMSTIDSTEIQKILQARCEMSAIQQTLVPHSALAIPQIPVDGQIVEQTDLSNASKVISLSKDALQSTDGRTNTSSTLKVTPQTKYVVNGQEATASDIQPGDTVMYVQYLKYRQHVSATNDPTKFTTSSETLESRVTYIIKADLPIEYYGSDKQGQIAQVMPCFGNKEDSCVQTGIVDLYQDDGNNLLGSKIVSGQAVMREIQLTLTSIQGAQITGTSTSGRKFSATLPVDAIEIFNTTKSSSYNNVSIGVGDTILIRYYELAHQNSTTIDANRIEYVGFLIEMIHENDPVTKY